MRIGPIDLEERILIVAEIGNNHEGSFENAERLVREAAACQVDMVKFQTFQTKHFTSPADPARFARLQSFELSRDQFAALERLARSLGLLFMSTPLDLGSADFLAPLVDAFKIASGDNNFEALLEKVADSGKPVIISSGLADEALITRAHRLVTERWREKGITQKLAILHCVCSYPAPDAEANLRCIPHLRDTLGCTIGYSDHTSGPDAVLAAAAIGARILEKHFTLDKNFSAFRDHQLSADPDEMRHIVKHVRKVETLLGRPVKEVQPSERPNQIPARRSIVAGRDLPAGHVLTRADLSWLRPAQGLHPGEESLVVGRRLKRALTFGELLQPADLEVGAIAVGKGG